MLNIIGQIFGSSGYASHTRQLANALNKVTDARITTQLFPGFEREINDNELQMIKRSYDPDETNLIITHPNFWRMNCLAKRNFAYLVWEGDRVPDYFIEECLNPNIEKIIVPSEHVKNAILKTWNEVIRKDIGKIYIEGYKINNVEVYPLKKIVVIPHGVDKNLFYPRGVDRSTNFTFMCNKGLRNMEDRGGVQYLIKAFFEEFTEQDKVELLIKLNPAYGIPDLVKMFPEIQSTKLKIICDVSNYKYEELSTLYNKCDVFVSPTRAEAFNIPCLEAMSCGKPVITTNFGGQTDYVKDGVGWMIDYKLSEVQHEIAYEGTSWATPEVNDLRKKLRYVYEHQDEVKQKGFSSWEAIKELTWDNTANQIIKLVK